MQYFKRLYDLRTDNDLRQEDVAKILNITKQAYGRYEKGTRKLPIDELIKLAEFYKVSTDYILGITDDPEPRKNSTNKQININGNKNKFRDITIK